MLLDALGDPIPGTTQTDFWTACTQGMPVNFNPVVTSGLDIDLFWDVVPIAPGFNPAVGEGFYQIELYAEPFVPEILFGAHDIGVANHRIPWNDFGGDAPGFEDGRDGGLALSQLDNGDYHVEVMAFSQPAPENPGHGHECFVRDNAEDVFFTKGDASIVFFEPANL